MSVVLVVDDVPNLAEQYAYDLKRVGGYDTRVATGGKEALDVIDHETVDCIILDLEMPGVDGFEVLRTLRKQNVPVPVIVYTGTGDYDRCAKAIRLGAYSFVDKAEPMERVAREVENALERAQLEVEIATLKKNLGDESPLVGSSQAMLELKEHMGRVAGIPSPILIVGESGTGKELVARELHRLHSDAKRPFVAINCATLPDNLIDSELFGHRRGAFTGANQTHKGAFERANGGTLFLDEIGELPTAVQAKLLRVLEEGEVTRLGGENTIKIDTRVLAATNRDLEAEVAGGGFREDLYYRLNVHIVTVPPLRERASDIPELAEHFLASTCARFGMRRKKLAPDALHVLMAYDWRRNNVRELRNIIERVIIATDENFVRLKDVPPEIRGDTTVDDGTVSRTFQQLKLESERQIIAAALDRNDWHITQTAKELGLADHASLLKIMRRHNLKRPTKKGKS